MLNHCKCYLGQYFPKWHTLTITFLVKRIVNKGCGLCSVFPCIGQFTINLMPEIVNSEKIYLAYRFGDSNPGPSCPITFRPLAGMLDGNGEEHIFGAKLFIL